MILFAAIEGCRKLPKDEAQAAVKRAKNAWMAAMLDPTDKEAWRVVFLAYNAVASSIRLKQGLFSKHNKKVLVELEQDVAQLASSGKGDWGSVEAVFEAYESLMTTASLAQLAAIDDYITARKLKGNTTWLA